MRTFPTRARCWAWCALSPTRAQAVLDPGPVSQPAVKCEGFSDTRKVLGLVRAVPFPCTAAPDPDTVSQPAVKCEDFFDMRKVLGLVRFIPPFPCTAVLDPGLVSMRHLWRAKAVCSRACSWAWCTLLPMHGYVVASSAPVCGSPQLLTNQSASPGTVTAAVNASGPAHWLRAAVPGQAAERAGLRTLPGGCRCPSSCPTSPSSASTCARCS